MGAITKGRSLAHVQAYSYSCSNSATCCLWDQLHANPSLSNPSLLLYMRLNHTLASSGGILQLAGQALKAYLVLSRLGQPILNQMASSCHLVQLCMLSNRDF